MAQRTFCLRMVTGSQSITTYPSQLSLSLSALQQSHPKVTFIQSKVAPCTIIQQIRGNIAHPSSDGQAKSLRHPSEAARRGATVYGALRPHRPSFLPLVARYGSPSLSKGTTRNSSSGNIAAATKEDRLNSYPNSHRADTDQARAYAARSSPFPDQPKPARGFRSLPPCLPRPPR